MGDIIAPQPTYGEQYRRQYSTTAHLWGAVQSDSTASERTYGELLQGDITAPQRTYGELYRAILLRHNAPMGSCTGR
jgi:hypothetical protein